MMTNGAMTKFLSTIGMGMGEVIYCLNTYCPYWLEIMGLAAVVLFN